MPERPASNAGQKVSTPVASDVTTPRPVTTTRVRSLDADATPTVAMTRVLPRGPASRTRRSRTTDSDNGLDHRYMSGESASLHLERSDATAGVAERMSLHGTRCRTRRFAALDACPARSRSTSDRAHVVHRP